MNCKLCSTTLTDENKCNAHIFPRGMLRAMSPDTFGNLLIVGTNMAKKRRAPTGIYDPNILCRDCDNKLGEYDDYALAFSTRQTLSDHPSLVGWSAADVDQQKLKLFCMSYIWRASITNRPEFKGVSLGAKHETDLKDMIKIGSPGDVDKYSTVIAKFNNDNENYGAILFPAKTRLGKVRYYEGFMPFLYKFWIKVDSQIDREMRGISLCAMDSLFVADKGDFHTSHEKEIMWRAANKSN